MADLFGYISDTELYYEDSTSSERDLLTGYQHWVSGSDSVIMGRLGKLTGNRSVLCSLDGEAHEVSGDGKFWIFGDLIVNGSSITGSGGSVSDGDKGDITVSGSGATWTVDNDAITYAKLQNVTATSRILGRKTAGAGDPEECTLSEILDFIGSAAQGDLLYRGASGWARIAAGTSGYFLKTLGAAANPAWDRAAGNQWGVLSTGGASPEVVFDSDGEVVMVETLR